METLYRHGDILLRAVGSIPATAKKQASGQSFVLARGEATGHTHTLVGTSPEIYVDGDDIFAKVLTETPLTHEEHKTIIIQPGTYKIVHEQQYNPFTKVLERVRD